MAEDFGDFLVSIGFTLDQASKAKAVAEHAAVEDKITADAIAEGARRVEAEKQADVKRIAAKITAGDILTDIEKRIVVEQDRLRRKAAEDDLKRDEKQREEFERRQADAAKKAKERRAAALKQMQVGAIRLTSYATLALGAIQGIALGIGAAADKAAVAVERLGYRARNAGASPASMTAAGYAGSQLGSSADAMQSTISAFGEKLKVPGYAKALSRLLGKAITDANGNLKEDTGDLLADLGDKLREIQKQYGAAGYQRAKMVAEVYDVNDVGVQNAIKDPRYRALEAEQAARQAKIGADPNAAAAGGTALEQQMRRVLDVIDDIKTKVETNVFGSLTDQLKKLSDWGDANGKNVADIITRIVNDLLRLATEVLNQLAQIDWNSVLSKVENFAKEFDAKTTKYFGPAGTILTVFGAFGIALGTKVIGPLGAVLAALQAIGAFSPPAWFLYLLGGSGAASWSQAQDTTKVLQKADPGKNNVVVDYTGSGFAQEVPDGAGNQYPGTADPKKGWFQRLLAKVGLNPDVSESRTKDDLEDIAKNTKRTAEILEKADTAGGPGGNGGAGASANRFGFGGSGGGFGRAARGGGGPSALTKQEQRNNAAIAADELRKAGAPDEGIASVLGSMQTESAFNPHAHNDVKGGHTGLWQWDARRWPKIEAWIKSQGGDPYSARWQTKAYIAEGLAKPGDPLFDSSETSAGFQDVLQSKGDVGRGVRGVRRSERFGIGEEGGREANARKWLDHLPSAPTAMAPVPAGTPDKAITDAEVFEARQRMSRGGTNPHDMEIVKKYLQQQNAAKLQKKSSELRHRLFALGGLAVPRLPHPLGLSHTAMHNINNSRVRGDTHVVRSDTYNLHGGDGRVMVQEAKRLAGRGDADLMRYLSSAES